MKTVFIVVRDETICGDVTYAIIGVFATHDDAVNAMKAEFDDILEYCGEVEYSSVYDDQAQIIGDEFIYNILIEKHEVK